MLSLYLTCTFAFCALPWVARTGAILPFKGKGRGTIVSPLSLKDAAVDKDGKPLPRVFVPVTASSDDARAVVQVKDEPRLDGTVRPSCSSIVSLRCTAYLYISLRVVGRN